jgi:hypothetical protein
MVIEQRSKCKYSACIACAITSKQFNAIASVPRRLHLGALKRPGPPPDLARMNRQTPSRHHTWEAHLSVHLLLPVALLGVSRGWGLSVLLGRVAPLVGLWGVAALVRLWGVAALCRVAALRRVASCSSTHNTRSSDTCIISMMFTSRPRARQQVTVQHKRPLSSQGICGRLLVTEAALGRRLVPYQSGSSALQVHGAVQPCRHHQPCPCCPAPVAIQRTTPCSVQ